MYNDLRFQAHALEQRYKSGARWFFWIAVLSLATSLLALTGSNFAFFLSLGVTQVIDGLAKGIATDLGDSVRIVGLIFNILVAGGFALIGWLALKRRLWIFVLGMVLFALDAMVLLVFQVWISFAFHGYVIFSMFKGHQAGGKLALLELEKQTAQTLMPPELTPTAVPVEVTPTL